MNKELEKVISKIKSSWDSMNIKSLEEIQALIRDLALEIPENKKDFLSSGLELYRDKELNFVLTIYSEKNGTYRLPHNHGNGWVIYSVVEGLMEMGNYINWIKPTGQSHLILKDKINLKSGDVKIYYPGDIHDTKCISENAIILRLTSCDLKTEESEGRMKRFNLTKSCSL